MESKIKAAMKAIVTFVMAGVTVGNKLFGFVPPDVITAENLLAVGASFLPFIVYMWSNDPKKVM